MTACEYSGRPPDTDRHSTQPKTLGNSTLPGLSQYSTRLRGPGKMISEHKITYQLGLPVPGLAHLK